ncbi:hypothetical protein JOD43_002718 [Pullulanibacillus pueri]|uniref:DUF3388 domain-containing protein n=1 Tax=Pullulanibacillus pueri TaxID=1437324 RepID=A0A8J2ZWR5_9BACL|nr:DUF3388 domain-containing protein [Pullulanibacillus pueri]MBM7682540.1 hypothetical protein [Pullulanibacillus pueri]GGH81993.1 hypothetical protein GCM10007096_20710 [Pullulanibacillus pueri]
MLTKDWYLEYEIQRNRPGLLGDIASLFGMLGINILSINGVDDSRRGMLLRTENSTQIDQLFAIVKTMDNINVTKLREPKLSDRLAVRHGRYLIRDADDKKTFRFVRDEIGLLVDFMAELYKKEGHKLIGIRGLPRVGKTESVVASSVCANKRWVFISSTLLKQTVRSQLADDEFTDDHIFIIDGIVSTRRSSERHWELLRRVMRMPVTKVVEHPDIFVRDSEYRLDDFDYIIELRNHHDEEITYDMLEEGYSAFNDFN